MENVLLPAGIVMTMFFVLWVAVYPQQLWLSMRFMERDTKTDIAVSVCAWVWFFGFVATICHLAR